MSKLIQEFRLAHVEISDAFCQIAQLGIGSVAGQQKLLQAKTTLLSHLEREDQELYPALMVEAESDPQLKEKLEAFVEDMASVSKRALAFFDKYTGRESDGDFKKDFNELYRLLTKRIYREEGSLYPEYDRRFPSG